MSKKKLVTAIVAGVLIVAIGVSSVLIYRKSHNTEAALADNQRYVYAYVSDIQGNEITYMEMDESVVTAYLEQQEEASATDDGEAEKDSDDNSASDDNAGGRRGRRENTSSDSASDNGSFKEEEADEASDEEKSDRASSGDMPSGDMPSGDMPSGDMPSGDMPSGAPSGDMSSGDMPSGAPSGGMPSGDMPSGAPSGDMPSGDTPSGDMPSGDSTDGTEQTENGMPSKASGKSGGFGKNAMGSGETVTALIPVGITVHTSSDVKTTFNRLVAGDMIKILMETNDAGEEVMVEIWML